MKKIKKFEALRGIACIIVLAAHWFRTSASYGIYASGCGKIGVWCFMIMSGFFLMLPYVGGVEHFSLRDYYLKKLFRIYPVYIVSLLLAVISGFIAIENVLPHILALEGAGHFWYMPVIIKLYLIYPLFIYLNKYARNRKVFVAILLSLAVILAFLFPYTEYPENSIELYWYMPIFVVGMLLAFLFAKIGDKKTMAGDALVIFGIAGIFIFTPFFRELLWGYEPSGYLQNKYLLIGFFWALIFVGIFCGKCIGEWLDNCRILQKIGKISFSIYLFHYLILDKINLYISNMLIKGLVLIVISVLLSVLMNKFIEEPLKTFTERLVGHKRG